MGFGAAALELRPTFKLAPSTQADAPAERMLSIAVEFRAREPRYDWGGYRSGGPTGEKTQGGNVYSDVTGFGGPALVARSVAMLNNPVWTRTVGYDDVVRAYPVKGGGVEGYAVAHCEVSHRGSLSSCQVTKEDPPTLGFGKAALALATRFRVSPEWATAPHHADVWVDVPFRFPAPGGQESRTITAPYWVSGFDPDQALKLFPPEAAERGVTTGHGVAKCVVAQDGTLTDCAAQEADPDGLGFAEAAAKLVSTMRMNPWTMDGAPVDGTVVRIGVRLNLKPAQGS
jgi:hypothetical protein